MYLPLERPWFLSLLQICHTYMLQVIKINIIRLKTHALITYGQISLDNSFPLKWKNHLKCACVTTKSNVCKSFITALHVYNSILFFKELCICMYVYALSKAAIKRANEQELFSSEHTGPRSVTIATEKSGLGESCVTHTWGGSLTALFTLRKQRASALALCVCLTFYYSIVAPTQCEPNQTELWADGSQSMLFCSSCWSQHLLQMLHKYRIWF